MAVLVKPLITEKMSLLSESKGQYGFVVDVASTKPEIKAEIEKMYNVEVEKIRTLVVSGKRKTRFTKSGVSLSLSIELPTRIMLFAFRIL